MIDERKPRERNKNGSFKKSDPIVRFWSFVNKTKKCWLWTGSRYQRGAGAFFDGSKNTRASRWSYEYHIGPIKKGYFVCHKCDEPLCVNPEHLFLGTHADNMKDMTLKERHWSQTRKDKWNKFKDRMTGHKNPNARFTEQEVLEIINDFYLLKKNRFRISKERGVSNHTISEIVAGLTYQTDKIVRALQKFKHAVKEK